MYKSGNIFGVHNNKIDGGRLGGGARHERGFIWFLLLFYGAQGEESWRMGSLTAACRVMTYHVISAEPCDRHTTYTKQQIL